MDTLSANYRDTIVEMMKHARASMDIGPDGVYAEANTKILPFVDRIVQDWILPASEIRSFQNLERLAELARQGKSCLLLLEHYSNFDLPVFSYLLRHRGQGGKDIESNIVAVAGIKLSQTDPVISAFAEAYSRLVIYPSRSLEIIKRNIKDPKELVSEMMLGSSINHAAMKKLGELKVSGKLILVFPAGTRYRPWDPSSKRGVREMDSYLRSFDYMCPVSINGNVLRVNPAGEMKEDQLVKDLVVYDVGEPIECHGFREAIKHSKHFNDDKKQAVVDALMAKLDAMHEAIAAKLEA